MKRNRRQRTIETSEREAFLEIRTLLSDMQNADGGWGARSTLPSNTESTAWATYALAGPPWDVNRDAVERGRRWLQDLQRPDGAWPHSKDLPQSHWMTSVAAIALSSVPEYREQAVRAAGWLLETRGRRIPWRVRLRFWLKPSTNPGTIDMALRGWPWYEETFSWVEPTAWALTALKRLRPDLPSGLTGDRIDEGERLLLDRVCHRGGWNAGNVRVYGVDLWPYADTTALGLIALQDLQRSALITESLLALERMIAKNHSGLSTALASLAFQIYGRPADPLQRRLALRYEATGFRGETRSLALAALALNPERSPLSLVGDRPEAGKGS